jgi:hypothetical protein
LCGILFFSWFLVLFLSKQSFFFLFKHEMSQEGGITYERLGGGRLNEADEDTFIDPFATDSSNRTSTNSSSSSSFTDDYDSRIIADDGDIYSTIKNGSNNTTIRKKINFPSSSSSTSSTTNVGDHLSSLDVANAISSPFALQGAFQARQDAAFTTSQTKLLPHERRSLWGQCSYNIGYSYAGGLFLGGLLGFQHGLRTSPNAQPRIILNSVLNGCGKYGAKFGNAAGVLALVFTVVERQLEDVEVDTLPGVINSYVSPLVGNRDLFSINRTEALVPVVSAFATGVLFTLPRAISMRGLERVHVSFAKRAMVCLVGGVTCTLGVGLMAVAGPFVFGDKTPFRFA